MRSRSSSGLSALINDGGMVDTVDSVRLTIVDFNTFVCAVKSKTLVAIWTWVSSSFISLP